MPLIFLAILPFILLFILLVFFKLPAVKVMPIIWILTLIITLVFWQLGLNLITASFTKGLLIALEIMLLIFSAVWLISILQEKHKIKIIHDFLTTISSDARIQAIIIAWLFGSLIEGIAGFGTPAALAAPLLVSLGFPAILAVVTSLIANSTAVSFGAAGTPILFGLGKLGFENTLLTSTYKTTALFHSIASLTIPIAIVYFVVSSKGQKQKTKKILETLPFIILAWLSFMIPYLLTAILIGPELPSIVGGLTSLIIASTAAHYNILTPKNIFLLTNIKQRQQKPKLKSIISAIFPYVLIIIFLTLSRTIPLIQKNLSNIKLSWNNIFNTNLNYQFSPLYTPTFTILIAVILSILIFKVNSKEIKVTFTKTSSRIKKPLIALIFALAFVQLLIVSEINPLSMPSIPLIIAQSLANLSNTLYIFFAPLIGIFGAFIAGSNTLSNFLFGTVQSQTALSLKMPQHIILALQVVGGAVGNMIAIHNILAANASVGLQNKEWLIIRKTIFVSLIYAFITAILAYITIYFIN